MAISLNRSDIGQKHNQTITESNNRKNGKKHYLICDFKVSLNCTIKTRLHLDDSCPDTESHTSLHRQWLCTASQMTDIVICRMHGAWIGVALKYNIICFVGVVATCERQPLHCDSSARLILSKIDFSLMKLRLKR